jgi:hypothetical protein
MSRYLLCGLTSLAFLCGAVRASADDDLDRIRKKQEIAVQKLKAEVASAIADSRNLEKTSSVNAKILLNEMIRQVRDSRDLLENERAALVRQLQVRLGDVNETARARKVAEDQRILREPPSGYRPPATDPRASGVTGAAKSFHESAKGAQRIIADTIREREKGINAINLSIERAAVATDKDIEFPSYWRELTERRKSLVSPKLTAKEIALLKTLNSVMSVDYNNEKFKSVLEHIQDKTGLSLIMDDASARDINLDYDEAVNFKVPKVTVRTILKKVLGDKGLTYIIKEGNIQVMTPKRAADHTVVRSYPVDDLVAPNQFAMMFGPFMQHAQMLQNAQQLINMIQLTVEPSYWQPNGPGTITFYAPTKTLLIRASAEMHYQMSSPGLFGR